MLVLPFRLQGRWKLIAEDVAAVFQPIVDEINGNLGARHFARRAGIRNDQKANAYSVLAVQSIIDAAASPTPANLPFACRAPQRYKTARNTDPTADAWTCFHLTFHYSSGGPFTGTLRYGGASGISNAQGIVAAAPNTAILSTAGDFADPTTGDVLGDLQITSGGAAQGLVLTAWFRARHQR